jgi:diaminohydroxyphosphoribosylaminopyrimidine deaminase/5-amino-6-(5-phosphoribosylamino)uracil reductase
MGSGRAVFMARAIRLARRAEGRTSPNPPVGAVVVKEGRVVGQGFHRAAGQDHAEVEALSQAGEAARGAELYVTLEPCNHQGRTPPCTESILRSGIKKVYIGAPDPNPGVAGGGAERLRKAGLEVGSGLLADRCRELLAPFAKHVFTGRPYVSLKLAASLDGRTGTGPQKREWLTGPEAKAWAHRLRDTSEAIMVGRSTVEVDDPALTTRLSRGRGQNPLRVVVDSKLRLSPDSKVVQGPSQGGPAGGGCLILTTDRASERKRKALEAAGARVAVLPAGKGRVDLASALDHLGRLKVMKLLVEGGPTLAGSLVRAGLVDRVLFILAPILIGGQQAPGIIGGPALPGIDRAVGLKTIKTRRLGRDLLLTAELAGG